MSNWVFKKPFGAKDKNWPKDEKGEPVKPAFLEHIGGSQLDSDMAVNLLTAFGIPVMRKYPNDGDLGRIVLGFSGAGSDIYVPETMIDDARNIISADIEDSNDEEDSK